MRIMKKYILPILAVAALAGCESIYVPTLKEVPVRPTNVKKPKADSQVSATGYHLAPSHWQAASKIPDEAPRSRTQQSKQYIQGALRGWQQCWKNMDTKPSNPAFTNFLMEVMGMQPLK